MLCCVKYVQNITFSCAHIAKVFILQWLCQQLGYTNSDQIFILML